MQEGWLLGQGVTQSPVGVKVRVGRVGVQDQLLRKDLAMGGLLHGSSLALYQRSLNLGQVGQELLSVWTHWTASCMGIDTSGLRHRVGLAS